VTTIDFQHADADVQRIPDSATDSFYFVSGLPEAGRP